MVDSTAFGPASPGVLTPIRGVDSRHGEWTHVAFVPHPLPPESPRLTPATYRVVANARAALAALDSSARQLPSPSLLRRPALQAEAQSTSALEGTYAPLADVLTADEDRPQNADLREILNYVETADSAFLAVEQGRPLSVGLLESLQGILVRRTRHEVASTGAVRDEQVAIGRRPDAAPTDLAVVAARFVPSPPGTQLRTSVADLMTWMSKDHGDDIDPVVAAGMAHYQFEALHPFHDGNGRIGRLLIVVQLLHQRVLHEPTLTVSPWFEARRSEYYEALFGVSATGDWDTFVRFFATGLQSSAQSTNATMTSLLLAQARMKETVRQSPLRADSAVALVDYAVGHPTFSVRAVERDLNLSYGRANGLVGQLCALGVLAPLPGASHSRRFHSPEVLAILLRAL